MLLLFIFLLSYEEQSRRQHGKNYRSRSYSTRATAFLGFGRFGFAGSFGSRRTVGSVGLGFFIFDFDRFEIGGFAVGVFFQRYLHFGVFCRNGGFYRENARRKVERSERIGYSSRSCVVHGNGNVAVYHLELNVVNAERVGILRVGNVDRSRIFQNDVFALGVFYEISFVKRGIRSGYGVAFKVG